MIFASRPFFGEYLGARAKHFSLLHVTKNDSESCVFKKTLSMTGQIFVGLFVAVSLISRDGLIRTQISKCRMY